MANFRNLISVPLVPDADISERQLCRVHQNAQSVGNAKKRSAINDFIAENVVDAFLSRSLGFVLMETNRNGVIFLPLAISQRHFHD